MYKKIIPITLVCLVLSSLAIGKALAEEKIALVSLARALNEVNEGKTAKAGLQKDFESKKKLIDNMKTEVEKLSKDLEEQKAVLSQDALKTKTEALKTKYLDLQNKAAEYEKDLKTKEAETAQKILNSLRTIVGDISKQEGYTLVIENSAQTVIFSKNAVDITDKLIATYNKK